MDTGLVVVLGGSGFVGRALCNQLVALGYTVRVPTRSRERVRDLLLLPTVEVVEADVNDPRQLERVVRGAGALINLVGVLHDGRGSRSFRDAHVELARKAVVACREAGVHRLLQMSALNARINAPSAYLRSKSEAEAIVLQSGLEATVFCPSVIFGRDDQFLNLFAGLLQVLPVIMLGSPGARFQPVYVEDVAAAFIAALRDRSSAGHSYDLCGPRVYTLRELVDYVARVTGRCRLIVGLNDGLSYAQAAAMELLPVKLLTRDNYYSMKVDSVSDQPFPFGIEPVALEAVAPGWLSPQAAQSRYQQLRLRAGR